MDDLISINHGSGGRMTHDLISGLFRKHFMNDHPEVLTDASIIDIGDEQIAFTTDSFVVDPLFFPGGDIGKLAVCGTVNDLAVSGANPLVLSSSFILEEGFPVKQLETIVASMQTEAKKAGVKIVTGDTKVVPKGKCDKLFINTSGIGSYYPQFDFDPAGGSIEVGDKVIISGTLGDHGMAILKEREGLDFKTDIQSDCASLNNLISYLFDHGIRINFMRDPTRGGLATTLCEITEGQPFGIQLQEDVIPVSDAVNGLCDLLGFDPLYVANEGKVMMVVTQEDAEEAVTIMRKTKEGKDAAIIGEVTNEQPGRVLLKTTIGGSRIVDMLAGDQLPRIC